MQQHAQQMHQQSLVLEELRKQIRKKGETLEGEASVGSAQSESRLAGKKVKLPLFDDDDPVAWITRAEIYFDVQNTSDDMRVKLARLSMEGRRLENPFEELSTLRQKGSVEEFVEAFELLSSQVGRLPEEQYLGYFISGLKPQIRRRMRTLNPRNRIKMMRIAKDVEVELKEEDDDGERRDVKKGGMITLKFT
ncbi:hypothetical protein KIW84_015083 [Lathyrus oleraceus]|uniref:Retrotransposon gag domain-containing protein n=1 Tax=Pisum sativum TaxID=3888 RepID=A0A9D5BPJ9_PEA|nr:hypothetical protein KIW84_015083 [Pisum sativum]